MSEARDAEIDPELVRLKRKVPIGPLLAVSVLGFALLVMWRFRADVVYAGRGPTPVDVGSAKAPHDLHDNGYVTLTGRPDGTAPARVRASQETGHRLAPFLGSGGRLWLEDSENAPLAFDDRWTGRLRRLDTTPLGEELGRYLATAPPVAHVVALGTALPTSDANGDPVAVTPETRLAVKMIVPDRSRVVFVRTDTVPDETAARAALAKLVAIPGEPVEKTDSAWVYEVAGSPKDMNAALRRARHFGAAAEPKIETAEGKVGDLDLSSPDAIKLAGRAIPRAAVDHALVWVARVLPADAWVMSDGDSPAAIWYMRPLYALVALVSLLMIWALLVDLRELRRSRPVA